MLRVLLGLCLFIAALSCAPKHTYVENKKRKPVSVAPNIPVPVSKDDPTWLKRWWLERTARLLRAGPGLGPDDDVNRLINMSDDQVIAEMMKDKRFADAVLDFNMYFLGFRADALREGNGSYTPAAFEFASAIESARATVSGGDYLKLFDLEAGLFIPPLRIDEEDDEPEDLAKARRDLYSKLRKQMKDLVKLGWNKKTKPSDFCKKVDTFNRNLEALSEEFFGPFDRVEVILDRAEALPDGPDTSGCAKPNRDVVEGITEDIEEQLAQFEKSFAEIFKFEAKSYNPKWLSEFKRFDVSQVSNEYTGAWYSFSHEMSMALMNSSTNMNRKRAAYALKNFFCDDLTPVGFESPAEHVGGPHGSQTTCYACHYKLDPMAGFFRIFGSQLQDYSKQTEIRFDDGVTTMRATYDGQWRNSTGTSREWNVGYVRSPDPRFENRNDYGESMADLSRILRGAPEVRRCLVKRLFAYAVGENQVLDGSYLQELVKKFETDSATSSGRAFQNLLTSIVKSRTFAEPNPDPDLCYDHGSSGSVPGAPPCRVAAILQNYCQNCHSTVHGPGGLDLSSWIQAPDGVGYTFPHQDRSSGQQKDRRETFSAIVDRLSTNDPNRRMPKGSTMPSQERQQLYLWAQEQL